MKNDLSLPEPSSTAGNPPDQHSSLERAHDQALASCRLRASDSVAKPPAEPETNAGDRASTARTDRPIRVLKYGGSLLTRPERWRDLQSWRQQQAEAFDVLVVGGGAAVDQLRAWNAVYDFPAHEMHQFAIEQMGFNARWLSPLLPGWGYWPLAGASLGNASELRLAAQQVLLQATAGAVIVDPIDWLRHDRELPRDWTVTSDTIAAYLAQSLGACELVLFKSTLPSYDEAQSRESLVCGSGVDLAFRHFSQPVPVLRWVDFSQPDWPQIQFGPMTLER